MSPSPQSPSGALQQPKQVCSQILRVVLRWPVSGPGDRRQTSPSGADARRGLRRARGPQEMELGVAGVWPRAPIRHRHSDLILASC